MQASANFYYSFVQYHQSAFTKSPYSTILSQSYQTQQISPINYFLWNIMDIFLAVAKPQRAGSILSPCHDCSSQFHTCTVPQRGKRMQLQRKGAHANVCTCALLVSTHTYDECCVRWQSSVFGAEIGVVVADSGGRTAGMSGMTYVVRSVSLPHCLLVGMV